MNTLVDSKTLRLGTGLTLLAAVIWGSSGAVAQWLFEYREITPEWLVPVRLLLSGIIMLAVNMARSPKETFAVFKNLRDVRDIAIYGLVGVALCQFSYFKTISLSNAGTACVLQFSSPVLIFLWVALKHKTHLTRQEIVSLFAAVIGVYLVSTNGQFGSLVITPAALFWGLTSAVVISVYTIQPARILSRHSSFIILSWGLIMGGIAISFFFPWWTEVPRVDNAALVWIGYLTLFGTIIGFTVFLEGVKRVGPTKAGLLACLEPVCATVLVALVFHTKFGAFELLGFFLILLVPFIVSFTPKTARVYKVN